MLIDDQARQQQAREIELELIRVRSAAEAARLEARAAELELLLRRMARGENPVYSPMLSTDIQSTQPPPPTLASNQENSWNGRLAKLRSRQPFEESLPLPEPTTSDSAAAASLASFMSNVGNVSNISNRNADSGEATWHRLDAKSASAPIPHIDVAVTSEESGPYEDPSPLVAKGPIESLGPEEAVCDATTTEMPSKAPTESAPAVAFDQLQLVASVPKQPSEFLASASKSLPQKKPAVPLPAVKPVDGEEEEETRGRFRPASWLVSTVAHVVIVILLGLMTLANTPPKDQLAFTASASESSEETMETFSIESSEPMETEPAPSETAYEISAIGTMAVTEVSMEAPVAPAPPTTSDFLSSSSSAMSSSMMKSLKSDSKVKTQFCGVEGGGNHFVYIVDSSGSMRDGFQSARTELLASIDQLKPDQRFYVIFFDSEPDFMRITNPDEDEPASVMATPENKQKLRRWAMTIQQGAGRHPTALLPFVLKMRPDVIFLLSDGEFPDSVGELLKSENKMENLFGESGPISIVHTIRYHGLEGETGRKAEATMIQIAKENGGQYRHVPKPKR
jgi:hypothetical protein